MTLFPICQKKKKKKKKRQLVSENQKAVNKVFDTLLHIKASKRKLRKARRMIFIVIIGTVLEKQIDDLTRAPPQSLEVNYTIPVRMEAETTGFDTVVTGTLTGESRGCQTFCC